MKGFNGKMLEKEAAGCFESKVSEAKIFYQEGLQNCDFTQTKVGDNTGMQRKFPQRGRTKVGGVPLSGYGDTLFQLQGGRTLEELVPIPSTTECVVQPPLAEILLLAASGLLQSPEQCPISSHCPVSYDTFLKHTRSEISPAVVAGTVLAFPVLSQHYRDNLLYIYTFLWGIVLPAILAEIRMTPAKKTKFSPFEVIMVGDHFQPLGQKAHLLWKQVIWS